MNIRAISKTVHVTLLWVLDTLWKMRYKQWAHFEISGAYPYSVKDQFVSPVLLCNAPLQFFVDSLKDKKQFR